MGIEFTNEQSRIVKQISKHVSKELAVEINLFFLRGGSYEDLHDVLVAASESLRPKDDKE